MVSQLDSSNLDLKLEILKLPITKKEKEATSESHQRIESELKQRKDELFCQKEKVGKLTQENSKIKLDLEKANRWTKSSTIVNHISSKTQNERVGIGFHK